MSHLVKLLKYFCVRAPWIGSALIGFPPASATRFHRVLWTPGKLFLLNLVQKDQWSVPQSADYSAFLQIIVWHFFLLPNRPFNIQLALLDRSWTPLLSPQWPLTRLKCSVSSARHRLCHPPLTDLCARVCVCVCVIWNGLRRVGVQVSPKCRRWKRVFSFS